MTEVNEPERVPSPIPLIGLRPQNTKRVKMPRLLRQVLEDIQKSGYLLTDEEGDRYMTMRPDTVEVLSPPERKRLRITWARIHWNVDKSQLRFRPMGVVEMPKDADTHHHMRSGANGKGTKQRRMKRGGVKSFRTRKYPVRVSPTRAAEPEVLSEHDEQPTPPLPTETALPLFIHLPPFEEHLKSRYFPLPGGRRWLNLGHFAQNYGVTVLYDSIYQGTEVLPKNSIIFIPAARFVLINEYDNTERGLMTLLFAVACCWLFHNTKGSMNESALRAFVAIFSIEVLGYAWTKDVDGLSSMLVREFKSTETHKTAIFYTDKKPPSSEALPATN